MSVSQPGFYSQGDLWRQRLASSAAALALFCGTAFIFMPKGFAAFGVLLIVTTLLAPDFLADAWSKQGKRLGSVALLAVLVAGLAIISMLVTGQGWRTVDNYARFLLIPWCGLLALALAPSRTWLWIGAIAGVFFAAAIAMGEIFLGVERAGGGGNPIVFANAVLALLVVTVFCGPQGRRSWMPALVATTLALGTLAIVLSGSRGVLPGLGLLVLLAAVGGDGPKTRTRIVLSLGALLLLLALMCMVPWLTAHMRLENIQTDLQKYAAGHVDSALGARLKFLSLAWHAFLEHPWTGVGIDRFGTLVAQLPECRLHEPTVCQLRHAHNDLAQWSATLGIPGLLLIVALYLVPAAHFLRLIVTDRLLAMPRGSAWAGLVLVVLHMLSGITQSMFAHAMTTTLYSIFVGLLLGLALREKRPAASLSSA
ncbi:MAG: O-antigen ligase family protein [Pseudoxanthomonas sp.]